MDEKTLLPEDPDGSESTADAPAPPETPERTRKKRGISVWIQWTAVLLALVIAAVICFVVIPYRGPIATISRAAERTLSSGAFDVTMIVSTAQNTELSLVGSVIFDVEARELTADLHVSTHDDHGDSSAYRLLIYDGIGVYQNPNGENRYGDMSSTVSGLFDRLESVRGYADFQEADLRPLVEQYYSSLEDAVDYPQLRRRLKRLVRDMNRPYWMTNHFSSYDRMVTDSQTTYGGSVSLSDFMDVVAQRIRPAFSDGAYFDYVKQAYQAGLQGVSPARIGISLQDGFVSSVKYVGPYQGTTVDFSLSFQEIGSSSISKEKMAEAFAVIPR